MLQDRAIFEAINEEPQFWRTYRGTCQTTLFITLGRIFDPDSGGHSIQKLISSTIANFQFFSRAALRARQMQGQEREPEYLSAFIAAAWEPGSPADLRFLKKALRPHAKLFEQVYRPIRHNVYAHRLKTNEEAAHELFPKTDRELVRAILDSLHEIIEAIIDLYNNGNQPRLGRRNFTEYNERIRDGARNVLRKLANWNAS